MLFPLRQGEPFCFLCHLVDDSAADALSQLDFTQVQAELRFQQEIDLTTSAAFGLGLPKRPALQDFPIDAKQSLNGRLIVEDEILELETQ